jgi:hypothetical protein
VAVETEEVVYKGDVYVLPSNLSQEDAILRIEAALDSAKASQPEETPVAREFSSRNPLEILEDLQVNLEGRTREGAKALKRIGNELVQEPNDPFGQLQVINPEGSDVTTAVPLALSEVAIPAVGGAFIDIFNAGREMASIMTPDPVQDYLSNQIDKLKEGPVGEALKETYQSAVDTTRETGVATGAFPMIKKFNEIVDSKGPETRRKVDAVVDTVLLKGVKGEVLNDVGSKIRNKQGKASTQKRKDLIREDMAPHLRTQLDPDDLKSEGFFSTQVFRPRKAAVQSAISTLTRARHKKTVTGQDGVERVVKENKMTWNPRDTYTEKNTSLNEAISAAARETEDLLRSTDPKNTIDTKVLVDKIRTDLEDLSTLDPRASGIIEGRIKLLEGDRYLGGSDGTALDLFLRRREFDQKTGQFKGSGDFEADKIGSEVDTIIRDNIHDTVKDLSGAGDAITGLLSKQRDFYTAKRTIADKVRAEGANVLSRALSFIKKKTGIASPTTPLAVGATIGGIATDWALVSGALATGGTIYLANALRTSPALRLSLARLLKEGSKGLKAADEASQGFLRSDRVVILQMLNEAEEYAKANPETQEEAPNEVD